MTTPNNRSSSYDWSAKNLKITGDGTAIKGHHDRGYEAGKKYKAKWWNPHRAIFDGIEIDGWSEGATTEGAEWGTTAISPSLFWPVFLDDDGGLTTTQKDIYIGEAKGTEVEIRRDRGLDYHALAIATGLVLKAWDIDISTKDTWYDYSSLDAYDLWSIEYEGTIPFDGTYRFACDLQSGNSSSSIYAYMGLYINDVYVGEVNTAINWSFETKYIDRSVSKGDNFKYRLRTSSVSYQASMTNKVVKSGWYMPVVTTV